MNVLVTGGTGFVGQRLLPLLSSPVVTSRNADWASKELGSVVERVIQWDPDTEPLDLKKNQFQAVVNLMGEPIAGRRWTSASKQRIRDSRVLGTQKLVTALLQADSLPDVLLSASAVGIYGDRGEEELTESSPIANDFLATVCQEWESQTAPLQKLGVRVIHLRIGIVLGSEGGAMKKMLPMFARGLGGKLGTGQQWVPWIHVTDLVSMIHWCLETPSVSGVVNATAPNPVRNADLTSHLARRLHRPAWLRVPPFLLQCLLGEFGKTLLYSQRVIPDVALSQGFKFQYPMLEEALCELLH